MLVLCDDPDQLPPSSSGEQIRRIREVAMVLGCAVYTIPPDFERCETGETALWHVPSRSATEVAVWAGYVPSRERYKEIYDAALAKNIKLVNDPEQHRMAMELDVAYPFLEGLTPESLTLRSPAECAAAGDRLGYPIFVKGAVQSRK